MTTVQRILMTEGPMLSGELAKRLAVKESLKVNTASQRINRASEFNQIKGFFKSNQSLCYLPEHAKDDWILSVLSDFMYENGRKYWYTLNALKLHEGIVSRKYLECYTNYPILPLSGHIPFETVIKSFIDQRILVYNESDLLFSPQFSNLIVNPALHRTIELIKGNILENFHSLARNTGLISYETGELFGEFGKFRWAFKGLSPVRGLKSDGKFGYLLGDVLIGKPFYEKDILFFIDKLRHIQSFRNASRIFPILLIDNLDKEALYKLKSEGIVIGFIKELFGDKYAESLKELIGILNNAAASLKKDPDKYLDLIRELRKYNEGLLNNIRGTLFEFVVGHIHQQKCQSLNMGREIIMNNSRHEMDIEAIYSSKVVIAECKAQKSLVNLEAAETWLTEKIPAFRNWILKQDTLKTKRVEFEYWSTSGFMPDAETLLNDAAQTTERYKISIFGPEKIRDRAKQIGHKKLKESLDNFFLKPQV
ncbi:hypothetical protein A3860_38845 [Niastella vici]|uniref:NERD domain-containing protein n=1 Tax=Niastella vici TaxID=1703345 RepID=A0A1V9FLC5_9BACT|nr:hypothetical protein [Niastella vici]OQP59130.1 hypothetical protein A3860_38845 [Niastella vici]